MKDKAFSSTPPGASRSNLAGHGAAASEQRAASILDRDTIERAACVGKNPVASVDRYRVALLAVIAYLSVASRRVLAPRLDRRPAQSTIEESSRVRVTTPLTRGQCSEFRF